ncbi:CDP-alcohol phosphatidyltransferase family protein [Azotobacter vinelandii]|uniref:CDP-alcohol phosphatidyltransferase family protein n=1 Tax=Azotobacter vinelandii TaxID=354 RepID=UPI002666E913|nr:CDP-alcohol phosphatidyltransferase family protein [Azotobacter vinelandii]WKN20618.1 CDP-alcohol phosphatidyltransferase family protein [Azotobacter vinelandii]
MHRLPNLLTLLRFLLVPPVAWSILAGAYGEALLLFVLAGSSDALDGFLARRFGWGSRLGALLDPLADKLLLVSGFVCLSLAGLIPGWLVLVVLARDVLIVAGALCYRWRVGRLEISPSRLGKLSTFLQSVLVSAVLLQASLMPAATALLPPLIALVVLGSLVSAVGYVREWTDKYRRHKDFR